MRFVIEGPQIDRLVATHWPGLGLEARGIAGSFV